MRILALLVVVILVAIGCQAKSLEKKRQIDTSQLTEDQWQQVLEVVVPLCEQDPFSVDLSGYDYTSLGLSESEARSYLNDICTELAAAQK
jgi:hypothetical protein